MIQARSELRLRKTTVKSETAKPFTTADCDSSNPSQLVNREVQPKRQKDTLAPIRSYVDPRDIYLA